MAHVTHSPGSPLCSPRPTAPPGPRQMLDACWGHWARTAPRSPGSPARALRSGHATLSLSTAPETRHQGEGLVLGTPPALQLLVLCVYGGVRGLTVQHKGQKSGSQRPPPRPPHCPCALCCPMVAGRHASLRLQGGYTYCCPISCHSLAGDAETPGPPPTSSRAR